jgi:hypothetical protein
MVCGASFGAIGCLQTQTISVPTEKGEREMAETVWDGYVEMKEKLVELLKKAKAKEQYDFLFGDIDMPHGAEYYADYLIADGWTKPEWISVKERLPTEEDAIEGGFVLANTEEKVIIALWSDVCRFNEFVTHWMPLPPFPKGE